MDGSPLDLLTIQGFKSIRSLESFKLGSLNVLIGANGAGKSNFVEFFELIRHVIQRKFQEYIHLRGGADICFYLGPKLTRQIEAQLCFGKVKYTLHLVPTDLNAILVQEKLNDSDARIHDASSGLEAGLEPIRIPRCQHRAVSAWFSARRAKQAMPQCIVDAARQSNGPCRYGECKRGIRIGS